MEEAQVVVPFITEIVKISRLKSKADCNSAHDLKIQ
jgi:hypothetical protein